MKTAWHDIWGAARGPIRRLAPQSRIACGTCAFAICMVAPASTAPGAVAIGLCTVLFAGLCRPPSRVVSATLGLGLVLFLPYFLLTPLIRADAPSRDWLDAFAVPWAILLHGMAAMQVSVSTVTALSATELRQGLVRLPIPSVISAVVLQIVHQMGTLVRETRRIAAAVSVRSGSSGLRTALRVVASLPSVWLPRVIDRAERVAAAMEMRGYSQRDLRRMGTAAASAVDVLAVGLAILGLAGAVALRVWGGV